jgi:hypothetical protein
VNHRIPVMTNHRPGGKPGSVRSHMQGETGSIVLTELGVIGNLSAALEQ